MIELKEAVQQTVVSSEFSSWAANQSAKVKEEAAAVKFICLNEEGFWKKESQLVEIFAPVVKLLRLTDSALPALSKVSCCDSQTEGSWHDNPILDQARLECFHCVAGVLLLQPLQGECGCIQPHRAPEGLCESYHEGALGLSAQ